MVTLRKLNNHLQRTGYGWPGDFNLIQLPSRYLRLSVLRENESGQVSLLCQSHFPYS
jgi:hypothetical protein